MTKQRNGWRKLRSAFPRRLVVALILTLPFLAVHWHAVAQVEFQMDRVESYSPHFPEKRKMNHLYSPKLAELKQDMQKRMEAGENLVCAAHIVEETHWLIEYTDKKKDIERRLKDLRQALDSKTVAPEQDPKDGSFGACFDSWIWRFFRSVDPLKELALEGKKPKVPLKIWDPVDTPGEIEALMKNLLVSDLKSGHNNRKELNLAITALGQLLWLDYTASVFPEHLDRAALAQALWKFVSEEWQDPATGYWGAWYLDGDKTYKTHDLSITFHIISYRGGKVAKLEELAETTFAIRDVRYPDGWDTGGTQNNHHAYDIARIINLTWDSLDDVKRAYADASLFLLTTRSLGLSINGDGSFDTAPYTTVGEAYYFGVSFFTEIGLFGNKVPRDSGIVVTGTENLLRQIRQNLKALDQADPWVAATHRKLQALNN